MPIRGFVSPTTVPCRLTVWFPPPWCHWGYCPCVGCVLLTLTTNVTTPSRTLFCNLMMIFLRTSTSGDLERLNFAPQPIHRWIVCRIVSLSVRYNRLTSSSWSSRHSVRSTMSGRVEFTPSSSRPTFLEFRVCWSWREDGGNSVWVLQRRWPKLEKPAPIEKNKIKCRSKNPANLFPKTWRALSSHTQCRIGSVCCNWIFRNYTRDQQTFPPGPPFQTLYKGLGPSKVPTVQRLDVYDTVCIRNFFASQTQIPHDQMVNKKIICSASSYTKRLRVKWKILLIDEKHLQMSTTIPWTTYFIEQCVYPQTFPPDNCYTKRHRVKWKILLIDEKHPCTSATTPCPTYSIEQCVYPTLNPKP